MKIVAPNLFSMKTPNRFNFPHNSETQVIIEIIPNFPYICNYNYIQL